MEVLSWGSCYALSTYRPDLLRVFSSNIWVAVCGRSVRSLVIACGVWRGKNCENCLDDNSGIFVLNIIGRLCECSVFTFD